MIQPEGYHKDKVLQIDIDVLFLSVLLIGDLPPRQNHGGCFEGMKENHYPFQSISLIWRAQDQAHLIKAGVKPLTHAHS